MRQQHCDLGGALLVVILDALVLVLFSVLTRLVPLVGPRKQAKAK
jgi:hypothetical protein